MLTGMATRKITVTLPVEQVDGIQQLVASGASRSISAFVAHAVSLALDDVAGWAVMLDQALADTGGDLTPEERAWADSVLTVAPGRQATTGVSPAAGDAA